MGRIKKKQSITALPNRTSWLRKAMPLSSVVNPHRLHLVTMRIRIHLFISMWIQIRIRIQGAKLMRIRIRIRILVRLWSHKMLNFYMKNILTVGNWSKNKPTKVQKAFSKGREPGLFVSFINFDTPGSGSAFPLRIRLRIKDSQMNPDPQHCLSEYRVTDWLTDVFQLT
jgi:hypothetical protein